MATRYKYHVKSAPPITRDRDRKRSDNSRHDPRMAPIREQRKQEEHDFIRGEQNTTEQRSQYGSVRGPPPGYLSSTVPKQRSRRVSFSDDTIKRDYFTQYDSLGGTSRTDRAREMAREQQKDYYQDKSRNQGEQQKAYYQDQGRNQDRYINPDRRGDQNRGSVRNHNRAPAMDQTREGTREQSRDSSRDQIRGPSRDQDRGSMREQNRNFNRGRDPTYNSYRPPDRNLHNIHDRRLYNDTGNDRTENPKLSRHSRSQSAHEGFRDKTYNYSARNFKNFTFYNL